MLVGADDGAVDELHRIRRFPGQRFENPHPDARLRPAVEAVVDRGVRAIALRQVALGRAGAQHPENAIENPAVIHPRNAPRLVREQRRQLSG